MFTVKEAYEIMGAQARLVTLFMLFGYPLFHRCGNWFPARHLFDPGA